MDDDGPGKGRGYIVMGDGVTEYSKLPKFCGLSCSSADSAAWANMADNDGSNNNIEETYGASLCNNSDNSISLVNKNGTTISTLTVPYATSAGSATKATKDQSGNNIKSSYGASLGTSGNSLTLKNKNGTTISSITVPYATNASSANYATNASTADYAKTSFKLVNSGTYRGYKMISSSDLQLPSGYTIYGEKCGLFFYHIISTETSAEEHGFFGGLIDNKSTETRGAINGSTTSFFNGLYSNNQSTVMFTGISGYLFYYKIFLVTLLDLEN